MGEEAHKVWKGEPHERAMNAYYIGLASYILGDEDNGLAGFKNALFQDAGSSDPAHKSDFSPALYLQGRILSRRGNLEDAERSFEEARVRVPENPFLQDPSHAGNLLVIVDMGRGPEKVRRGVQGSRLAYFDHGGRVSPVKVHLDGETFQTASIGDVFFQATTRGEREFGKVLYGKAVAREVAETGGLALLLAGLLGGRGSRDGRTLATAGGALLLGSNLLRTGADTRHWGCLPREIHVFSADLKPGPHEVVVDLPVARRVREEIVIESGRDTVLYYRAGIPFERPHNGNTQSTSTVTRGEVR
jgi:hypothetical protein